jgi:hypothetical protein
MRIPGGAVQFFVVLLGGWLCTHYASRFHVRSTIMTTANTICIISSALLVGLPTSNKWGRLVALWLCYCQAVGLREVYHQVPPVASARKRAKQSRRACVIARSWIIQDLGIRCDYKTTFHARVSTKGGIGAPKRRINEPLTYSI